MLRGPKSIARLVDAIERDGVVLFEGQAIIRPAITRTDIENVCAAGRFGSDLQERFRKIYSAIDSARFLNLEATPEANGCLFDRPPQALTTGRTLNLNANRLGSGAGCPTVLVHQDVRSKVRSMWSPRTRSPGQWASRRSERSANFMMLGCPATKEDV